MHFFITGTDTSVGKTWFTAWLVRAWKQAGFDCAALKPIASGDREDAIQLQKAMGSILTLDEINPLHFREPAAPIFAAQAEKRSIDFTALNNHIRTMGERFPKLAVEGVGGWRVPLAPKIEVREWAKELGLPVIVVARGTLGTLNHTLLTVDSIRDAGLTCAGVVVNAGPPENLSPDLDLVRRRNVGLLRDLLGLPLLELDGRVQAAGELPVWLGGK